MKPEDVIYFQKTELVDSVTRSKDGVVRKADLRYFNHGENKARFTDSTVRSLVRLFNIEDDNFVADMAKVEVLMDKLQEKSEVDGEPVMKVEPTKLVDDVDGKGLFIYYISKAGRG